MVRYAAFLRGIAPLNPNMKNARLREVFERAGFTNVQTVISSGNVLFQSEATAPAELETLIERMIPEQLGFTSATFILSQHDLSEAAENHPFTGMEAAKTSDLFVAFVRHPIPAARAFRFPAGEQGDGILSVHQRALFCRLDPTDTRATGQFMRWLEKEFSREVTTRTWRTVQRVLKRLEEMPAENKKS